MLAIAEGYYRDPESVLQESRGVRILGAGRSLQVVRADAYSDHPCDCNTHGSQAKREHWFTGGVGAVPSDVPA